MEDDDEVSQDVSTTKALPPIPSVLDHEEQQQQSRREYKIRSVTSPSQKLEGDPPTENTAREDAPMEEPLQGGIQIPDTHEVSSPQTDHHGRSIAIRDFPSGTRTEESSGFAGRTRQKQRARVDRGKGHGFEARFVGCGAKHIKFDDDAISEKIDHGTEEQGVLLKTNTVSQSEAVMVEPDMRNDGEKIIDTIATADKGSMDMQPRLEANIFETLPDDVFFAIFDHLVSYPLHLHSLRGLADN
jgi:hypothetical protein